MHSTKQRFLKDHSSHFRVVLVLKVGNRRQHAMRLGGKTNVRGLEGFGHSGGFLGTHRLIGKQRAARHKLDAALRPDWDSVRSPAIHGLTGEGECLRRKGRRPEMFNDLFVGHANNSRLFCPASQYPLALR
jgi:hypothetical protein